MLNCLQGKHIQPRSQALFARKISAKGNPPYGRLPLKLIPGDPSADGQVFYSPTLHVVPNKDKGVAPVETTPINIPGDDLLSHAVTHAVPSAQAGLTALFGMGRGIAPPL